MPDLTWRNETRRLGDLVPWEENPRQITEAEGRRLVESLAEFGQIQTVAIEPDGTLIDGHQRRAVWAAAREFGPDYQVDVRVASRKLTHAEREKLVVYLHAGATGGWDWDKFAAWNPDVLDEWGMDDDLLSKWYDDAANLALMREAAEDDPPEDPGAQVDRAEELREKWGVEVGQLWRLGEHRLICGDCTDADVVARVMGGEKDWYLLTDPPYGIDAANMQMGVGKREFPRSGEWDVERVDILRHVDAARKSIVWGGNYYADCLPVTPDWLAWHKKNDGLSYSEFELAWSDVGKRARMLSHHWSGEEKLHITQKPLPVIEWCVGFFPGDLVIHDPFVGSGTTIAACERLGRKCRAVEIAPAYCAVAIERWAEMTGETPERVE